VFLVEPSRAFVIGDDVEGRLPAADVDHRKARTAEEVSIVHRFDRLYEAGILMTIPVDAK
jgi:hypothetical protein